jgi:hypothetical protein
LLLLLLLLLFRQFSLVYFLISVPEVNAEELGLTNIIEASYIDDVTLLRNILDHYKTIFHPQHFLILILKWLLLNVYGRKRGLLYSELSKQNIEDKIQYCKDYLLALDIIGNEP